MAENIGDIRDKEQRNADAAYRAGMVVAGLSAADKGEGGVPAEVALAVRTANEIAGEAVTMENVVSQFATPGERQDFYFLIIKAAFLKKIERENGEAAKPVEEPKPEPVKDEAKDAVVPDKPVARKAANKGR